VKGVILDRDGTLVDEGGPGGDPTLARPCDCRKPAPGLLLQLGAELGLDFAESWMIGDTSSDVDAAARAGLRAGLLLDTRRCELCPNKACGAMGTPALVAPRFDALAALILAAAGGDAPQPRHD
jgi:D-glycero-D-manno-heptose 1,7-bisphosphate phosphatase